ncbi:hypothetical protein [Pedococcus aerophilus]
MGGARGLGVEPVGGDDPEAKAREEIDAQPSAADDEGASGVAETAADAPESDDVVSPATKVTMTPEVRAKFAELAGFPSAEVRRTLAGLTGVKGLTSPWQGHLAEIVKVARPSDLFRWADLYDDTQKASRLGDISVQLAGLTGSQNLSRYILGTQPALAAKLLDGATFKGVQHAALSGVLEAIKASDVLGPNPLSSSIMGVSSQLSKVVLSDSAFTQWRAATGLHATMEALSKSVLLTEPRRHQFEDLARLSVITESMAKASSDILGSRPTLAARPMLELESYARLARSAPMSEVPGLLWPAGHGVTGLAAHDAFVAISDPDESAALAVTVEHQVVAPWEEAANGSRRHLYERLDELDPDISELLRGAWESVARPGPADVVKVGACTVEAVIRALRVGAPDEMVTSWLTQTGRRVEDFVQQGKVMRKARVRYLLRDRKGDMKVVEAQADALSAAVEGNQSRLQAAKHASSGDLAQARAHLVTAESILTQLFAVD